MDPNQPPFYYCVYFTSQLLRSELCAPHLYTPASDVLGFLINAVFPARLIREWWQPDNPPGSPEGLRVPVDVLIIIDDVFDLDETDPREWDNQLQRIDNVMRAGELYDGPVIIATPGRNHPTMSLTYRPEWASLTMMTVVVPGGYIDDDTDWENVVQGALPSGKPPARIPSTLLRRERREDPDSGASS